MTVARKTTVLRPVNPTMPTLGCWDSNRLQLAGEKADESPSGGKRTDADPMGLTSPLILSGARSGRWWSELCATRHQISEEEWWARAVTGRAARQLYKCCKYANVTSILLWL